MFCTEVDAYRPQEIIMDEMDDLKSQINPKEFVSWDIEDLENYIVRLKVEIKDVEAIISEKKSVSSAAEALFKS